MGCDMSFLKKSRDLETGGEGAATEKRVLLLGLDNAGKTSILFQLRDKEFKDTVPTVGLNIEHIVYKKYSLTMWDVGGQATKLWKHYFEHVNGIVFVIDSTDEERLILAKDELLRLLVDDSLRGVPILLFYNKRDLPEGKESEELSKRLELDQISASREVAVQDCSALNGEGIWEGLDKLVMMFEERKGEGDKQEEASTKEKP